METDRKKNKNERGKEVRNENKLVYLYCIILTILCDYVH